MAEFGAARWQQRKPAGHAQVDHDGGIVIEVKEQVLGAAPDILKCSPLNALQNVFWRIRAEHAGEIANVQADDLLTDDAFEK